MAIKKERIPIAKEIAANILYASDRTCCVCNERGKSVQIHHIDDDPSNNEEQNLAVLCFDCHEYTQIKGGFGRKLDAEQVIKYKSEWLQRVKNRRDKADEIASMNGVEKETTYILEFNDGISAEDDDYETKIEVWNQDKEHLEKYLFKIIDIKAVVYKHAEPDIKKGVTLLVVQGCNSITDFYEEVLYELSKFYPFRHFGDDPKQYINEQIGNKANWLRAINEPDGLGKGGTIVSIILSYAMVHTIDEMIMEMVRGLDHKYQLDLNQWSEKWKSIVLAL
jgi:hypothetical protein